MKKLRSFFVCIILFSLLCINSASAQKRSLFAKAGLNLSRTTGMDGNYGGIEIDSKLRAGYQFGVGLDYEFNHRFALQPALLLSMKGSNYDVKPAGDGHDNALYLELPIMAALKFRINDDAKFVVNAGPYVAYGIGGKSKSRISGESGEGNTFSNDGGYQYWDFGLGGGIGIEVDKFVFNLGCEFGLVDACRYSFFDWKTQNYSLTIGYKFYSF